MATVFTFLHLSPQQGSPRISLWWMFQGARILDGVVEGLKADIEILTNNWVGGGVCETEERRGGSEGKFEDYVLVVVFAVKGMRVRFLKLR